MDRYHLALFIHVVALIVAASASAVTKLAAMRRVRARTVGEALEWHNVLLSTARLFPICLAAFLMSGAYMLSLGPARAWSSGFAVSGLVGVALLFLSSIYLATKARGLKAMLEGMVQRGAENPAPTLAPPPLVVLLPQVNTGIALAVVFDMIVKPASIPAALGIIALGIAASAASAAGAARAIRRQSRPVESAQRAGASTP